jgi:hypothetical protein
MPGSRAKTPGSIAISAESLNRFGRPAPNVGSTSDHRIARARAPKPARFDSSSTEPARHGVAMHHWNTKPPVYPGKRRVAAPDQYLERLCRRSVAGAIKDAQRCRGSPIAQTAQFLAREAPEKRASRLSQPFRPRRSRGRRCGTELAASVIGEPCSQAPNSMPQMERPAASPSQRMPNRSPHCRVHAQVPAACEPDHCAWPRRNCLKNERTSTS